MIYDYVAGLYATVALTRSELEHLLRTMPMLTCAESERYTVANMAHLSDFGMFVAVVGSQRSSTISETPGELLIELSRRDLGYLISRLEHASVAVRSVRATTTRTRIDILGERDGSRAACLLPRR